MPITLLGVYEKDFVEFIGVRYRDGDEDGRKSHSAK